MANQFQLYKGTDADWWWRFVHANGHEIFRSSEGYKNRLDAVNGIELARSSATAERIEQHADGKWYFFTS